jgi:ABC-type uncharacterized transport system permease subunit
MPGYVYLIIIAAILVIWYMWSQYGGLYQTLRDNPAAVGAGQSVARYYTDIMGLANAYQAADSTEGNFMSRMGAFFGALPK